MDWWKKHRVLILVTIILGLPVAVIGGIVVDNYTSWVSAAARFFRSEVHFTIVEEEAEGESAGEAILSQRVWPVWGFAIVLIPILVLVGFGLVLLIRLCTKPQPIDQEYAD